MTTFTSQSTGPCPITIGFGPSHRPNSDMSHLARACFRHLVGHCLPEQVLPADPLNFGPYGTFGQQQTFWSCQHLPHLPASLSHTREGAAAAILDVSAQFLGVGLDLEWSDRPTRPDLARWLGGLGGSNLTALELWCVKEAIYKATQARYQAQGLGDVVAFKKMNVQSTGEFLLHLESETWQGEWRMDQVSRHGRRLLLASAYLKAALASS